MTPRTRPRMASQHADVGVGSADIGATCIRMRSEDALPSARRMPSAVAVLQATSMSSSAAVTTFGRHSTVSPRRIDATAVASHCDCGVASLDTMLISCQAAVLQHRPSQASAGHVIAVRVACGADDTAPRALFIRARPRSSVISPSSRLRGTSSRVLRMRRCGIGDTAEGAAPWKNTKIGKRPPVFPRAHRKISLFNKMCGKKVSTFQIGRETLVIAAPSPVHSMRFFRHVFGERHLASHAQSCSQPLVI